jgi:hypothetical protein
MRLRTQIDHENHLIHILQEKLHIELSEELKQDIRKTMRGSNRVAQRGCVKILPNGQTIKM